jgi:cell wall-associated NlpC family hydrolase
VPDPLTSDAPDPIAPVLPSAPPSRYGGAVGVALQYLGVPYRWGGADPSGFDCSGFTMYVYARIGVSLPHYTGSQFGRGRPSAARNCRRAISSSSTASATRGSTSAAPAHLIVKGSYADKRSST